MENFQGCKIFQNLYFFENMLTSENRNKKDVIEEIFKSIANLRQKQLENPELTIKLTEERLKLFRQIEEIQK